MGGEWTSLAPPSRRWSLLSASAWRCWTALKHPPAGVDVAAAKTDMTDATALWSKARPFAANDNRRAVTSAHDVKAKSVAAAAIKFSLPRPEEAPRRAGRP